MLKNQRVIYIYIYLWKIKNKILSQRKMEVAEGINVVSADQSQSCTMNAGDGPHGYTNNSSYQVYIYIYGQNLVLVLKI